jgi:23S rRNA (pseudouridine1915-N3)-methyltransferase
MKMTVITVGKIKEKFFADAIKEYEKRLSKYCQLKIVEVSDEKAPETLSDREMELVKDKEGERILAKIKDTQHVITLEIKGGQMTSEAFSERLSVLALHGASDIVFVIGGSLGLSDVVMKRSNEALSFSKMTFPHQLMRVVLLEQIYRAMRIRAGEPYHK